MITIIIQLASAIYYTHCASRSSGIAIAIASISKDRQANFQKGRHSNSATRTQAGLDRQIMENSVVFSVESGEVSTEPSHFLLVIKIRLPWYPYTRSSVPQYVQLSSIRLCMLYSIVYVIVVFRRWRRWYSEEGRSKHWKRCVQVFALWLYGEPYVFFLYTSTKLTLNSCDNCSMSSSMMTCWTIAWLPVLMEKSLWCLLCSTH